MSAVPPAAGAPALVSPPPAAPSPARGFAWAGAWALVAVLGGIVLVLNWQGVLGSELSGQRTEGIVLFTPIIAGVLAVLFAARGVWAIGAARAHRERTTSAERERDERQRLRMLPTSLLFAVAGIAGALWLAGTIVVLVFLAQLAERPSGLSLALMLLMLLAMAWIPALRAGLRSRAARATEA